MPTRQENKAEIAEACVRLEQSIDKIQQYDAGLTICKAKRAESKAQKLVDHWEREMKHCEAKLQYHRSGRDDTVEGIMRKEDRYKGIEYSERDAE